MTSHLALRLILRPRRRDRRVVARAAIETLEQRRMLNADIVVNTDLDESDVNATTSLREAVALAVATPGDDNITFDPAFFTDGTQFTITLGTDGPLAIPNTGGKVAITGLGIDRIGVSGGGAGRIFEIADGGALDVSGVTLSDGLSVDSPGGAIRNLGTLSLTSVAVMNNTAMGSDGADGDAVNPGQPGVDALGGAIYNNGILTVADSEISGNGTIAGNGGSGLVGGSSGGNASGGAIYALGGSVTLTNVTFNNNSVSGGSGGSGPSAGTSGGNAFGGALYVDGANLTISGGSFSSSFADGASGADNRLPGATGGNGGDAAGGAIYCLANGSITNTNFDGNVADGGGAGAGGGNPIDGSSTDGSGGDAFGGAIFLDGILTITGGIYSSNEANGGTSETGTGGLAFGGAIDNIHHLTISGASFDSNTATGGDSSGGTAATAAGGAIATQDTLDVADCTFTSNTARGGDGLTGGDAFGGAVNNSSSGSATIDRSTLSLNSATAGESGTDDTDGKLGGLAAGGAVNNQSGSVTVTNSTLDANTAYGGKGGDGAAGNGGKGGDASGGAIANAGTLSLTNSTIFGNLASAGIGGDGAIDGGDAGASLGGGILNNGAVLNALNITVAANQATSSIGGSGSNLPGNDGLAQGGGIYSTGMAALANALIADNLAESSGPDLTGTFTLTNSLVTSPSGGTYTLNAGSAGNLLDVAANLGGLDDNGGPTRTVLPNAGSPAIDAGSDTAAASLTFDQRGAGFPRILGDHVDIGAVEAEPGQPPADQTIRINFQPDGTPIPTGFLADVGKIFGDRGNGLTYGWNKVISAATRDRNLLSDQARDTLVHTQLYGLRSWEIVVPNGIYMVHLVAGDAQYFDSNYKVNVEGVLTVNGKPTSGNRFFEGTKTVVVSDGRLTITNAAGAVNNKLDFIEISPVEESAIRVNFQTPTSPTPPVSLADSGAVFGDRGSGFDYGWNASATSFARDRNNGASPDQRYDTLIHTQLYGTRVWEIAVPNGTYSVHLVAGDPSFIDSVYKYNVEGILTVSGTPTSANRWIEGTMTVSVADGRLTISNATGSKNNKIDFVEITPL